LGALSATAIPTTAEITPVPTASQNCADVKISQSVMGVKILFRLDLPKILSIWPPMSKREDDG